MRFEALLESNGKTATGFEVPEEIVLALGGGKRAKVTVTINGYTYRNSVAPMGGRYLVGVSAENRERADVSAGDRLEVELELDTATRVVEVPDDLAEALAAHPEARRFFDTLSYSQQQYYVQPVTQAKQAETRQRRIERAVERLASGKKP
jgi:hypothetical protein